MTDSRQPGITVFKLNVFLAWFSSYPPKNADSPHSILTKLFAKLPPSQLTGSYALQFLFLPVLQMLQLFAVVLVCCYIFAFKIKLRANLDTF